MLRLCRLAAAAGGGAEEEEEEEREEQVTVRRWVVDACFEEATEWCVCCRHSSATQRRAECAPDCLLTQLHLVDALLMMQAI